MKEVIKMRIDLQSEGIVEIQVKQGKNEHIYEYYIGSIKIGILDTNVMQDNILIIDGVIKNEEIANQIRDEINCMPRDVIERECEENKEIADYINERYGELEQLGEIRKIELEQDEEEKEKEEKSKMLTTKDINVKQSIDLDERANDMHDMRKWLGNKIPKEFDRIGVVESYQMNEYGSKNTTRYSLVVISKEGIVEPMEKYLPELKQRNDEGNNPRTESLQVRTDGSVERDSVLSEYELGNKIIQLDNKEMGRVEMNIGAEARNSNKTVTQEVRDENTTFVTDVEQRSVVGEYEANGEDTVEESIKEAEEHEKAHPECKKMNVSEIDGDRNTTSHVHYNDVEVILEDGQKVTFERLAVRWGLFDDNGQPDIEHARDKYLETQRKNIDNTPEEVIELVDEEYEDPRTLEGRKH